MVTLAGLDEAGYGPLLGPLVITAVAFEVRDHEVDGNLWEILRGAVTTSDRKVSTGLSYKERHHRPLAVADSKRLYSSRRGLRRLEDGVLAFQTAATSNARTVAPPSMETAGESIPQYFQLFNVENLKGFLEALHCYDESQLVLYPWYRSMQLSLPLAASLEEVISYRNLLREVLASRGIKFLGARAVIISPYEFNKTVESCGNKALLLFDNCVKLIDSLWEDYPHLEVLCDKHGGRNRYAALLSRAFSRYNIKVLSEGPAVSNYEITNGSDRLKVSFILKAEDKHLPVALASMYSKYLRELFLKLFNKYWQERLPGLKPTAGYPKDARRFLKDIDKLKVSLEISDAILIRNR